MPISGIIIIFMRIVVQVYIMFYLHTRAHTHSRVVYRLCVCCVRKKLCFTQLNIVNGELYYFASASIVSLSSVLHVCIYIFFSTKGCDRLLFFPPHKSFLCVVYNSVETISSLHLLSLVLPFIFLPLYFP